MFKTEQPVQGAWVQSLVGELRSHKPWGAVKRFKKERKHSNRNDTKLKTVKKNLKKRENFKENNKHVIQVYKEGKKNI